MERRLAAHGRPARRQRRRRTRAHFRETEGERDNDTLNRFRRLNTQPAASEVISSPLVRLKMSMRTGGLCTFAYASGDGPFRNLAPDFQAVEGVWIGAKVGLFCVTPPAQKVE